jgi:hypothetical protein
VIGTRGLAYKTPLSFERRQRIASYLSFFLQHAADEARAARLSHQFDVAHKLGTALSSLKHDFAIVECFKLRTVANADQGSALRLAAKEVHQLILAFGIERCRCLVKDDDIGIVKKDARERESLLFTT